jgi:hypothetical protein
MAKYRLDSGETLKFIIDYDGIEVVGDIADEGIHLILSWHDVKTIATILSALETLHATQG